MKKKINNTLNYIGYKGSVKTTLTVDGRPIQSFISHNAGCPSLFRFLCSCLAGDYADADDYRPLKLQLCKMEMIADSPKEVLNNSTPLSNLLTISEPPKINHFMVNNTENYTVTFHFVIPFSVLTLTSIKEVQINQLLLFSSFSTVGAEAGESALPGLIAYYKMPSAIVVGEKSDNVNLIVDWTMEFLNNN